MRKELIEYYSRKLVERLGCLRQPIDGDYLHSLYLKKDYAGMVACVRRVFQLDLRVRLGLVNSGGVNAPVWIKIPDHVPGNPLSEGIVVTVYLRKSFLVRVPFETLVLAIAHELAHIVLIGTQHELSDEEEAVDLTAMLLGFRDFYVTGCQGDQILSGERHVYRIGYLTLEEVLHASMFMTFTL